MTRMRRSPNRPMQARVRRGCQAARTERNMGTLLPVRLTAWIFAALLALLALLAGAGDAWAARWLIEPGQEALLLAMLGGGAELPGGCRIEGASVEKTVVVARYTCAAGPVRIELHHPSDAPPSAPRTGAFALVVPPGNEVPPAFLDALGARIRDREGAFRWTATGRAFGHSLEDAGVSRDARLRGLALGGAAALAFVLVFAVAVRLAPRLAPRPAAPPADRGRALLHALAAATLAFVLLDAAVPAPPVHPDTTRDFLMAADCLAGLPCDHGPPTSLGVLVQGALWTRFLALSGALGLGIAAVQRVLFALHAISAGLVLAALRRRVSPALAAWTAGAWVVLGAVVVGAPLLWNPSLAPLPLALFYLALVALVERGSLAYAAAAGGLVALAMDCHVVFAALVPVLLTAAGGCARRPAAAAGAALSTLAAVLLLDSRAAWVVNARAFASTGAAVPLAAVLVLAVVAGAVARPRLHATPPTARAAVFLATAAVLPVGATVLLHAVAGASGPARYFAPALPALALLSALVPVSAARSLARSLRAGEARLGVALGAVAVVASFRALSAGTGDADWSMTEAHALAAPLYGRVASYPALRAHLETRSQSLVTAMSLFDPHPARAATGDAGDDLLLFKAPKGRAPPPGPWVATVDLGRSVALVGAVRPFLDRTRIRACYAPLEAAGTEGGCVDTGLGADAAAGQETAEERAYPVLAAAREAFPRALLQQFGGVHESFAVRLAPVAGPAHRIELLAGQGGWTIEAVIGPPFRGALPAAHVLVEGVATEGTLVLGRSTPAGKEEPDRYWPPPVAEIAESDVALEEALEKGWLR
jgi:hypothetical protein